MEKQFFEFDIEWEQFCVKLNWEEVYIIDFKEEIDKMKKMIE